VQLENALLCLIQNLLFDSRTAPLYADFRYPGIREIFPSCCHRSASTSSPYSGCFLATPLDFCLPLTASQNGLGQYSPIQSESRAVRSRLAWFRIVVDSDVLPPPAASKPRMLHQQSSHSTKRRYKLVTRSRFLTPEPSPPQNDQTSLHGYSPRHFHAGL